MTMAATEQDRTNRIPLMILAWAWVTLPFLYGVFELIRKVAQLFNG
ncbi:hypothetical protein GCM10023191_087720 [Actinoallomurus oryzae]|uniref:Oxalate:formate antiporter n=1 Tax=Actinoallomurus oryzae TaxID=502180 RepID=A0ABP8R2K3_9ACTN